MTKSCIWLVVDKNKNVRLAFETNNAAEEYRIHNPGDQIHVHEVYKTYGQFAAEMLEMSGKVFNK